jgi:hypothetical protein
MSESYALLKGKVVGAISLIASLCLSALSKASPD